MQSVGNQQNTVEFPKSEIKILRIPISKSFLLYEIWCVNFKCQISYSKEDFEIRINQIVKFIGQIFLISQNTFTFALTKSRN